MTNFVFNVIYISSLAVSFYENIMKVSDMAGKVSMNDKASQAFIAFNILVLLLNAIVFLIHCCIE